MKIVLCGYMGSGKTKVGKQLSNILSWGFTDLDKAIEQKTSKRIASIFKEKGEIYFRKKESETLSQLLTTDTNQIISLGGGTPCYSNNLEQLKNNKSVKLVYLKVKLDVLTNRLFQEKEKRPLISAITEKEKLEDYIRKHLFERQFYYLQSDLTVNASVNTPQEIATKIQQQLN